MDRKTLRQAKLRELAGFQICGGFEDNLYRLTRIAGELLAAGRVSLMLLDSGHGKGSRLKLSALYGELPEVAWKEEQAPGQGVAGRVLASGVSARVNRIGRSAWKSTARRPDDAGAFMACPLFLAGEPAGVLNISNPVDREIFSADDLAAAELAALLIARAIQVGRLERMLDSRFAQMALTLEGSANAYTVTALSAHDPDKVAKMLAKGFYKELRHCGFTPNQIIHAAGEIISELTGSLNRHARRMERGR
ncbi:MAG: GAF domain-containing protein [Thiobacillaceae bacterium]|jgi:L-methionine (R)-S-oxide reductase|nr:GAF domain-containing protein [Thiobacillaceae bacterium]MBP9915788.1 GAF domain-containing protein [Thiobacillaceae bacterium]